MLRNTPLTRLQRRNLRFSRCCLSFRRFLFRNRCDIRFDLLDEGIPGKGFRIHDLSIYNAIPGQLFTDLFGINIVQKILCFWNLSRLRRFFLFRGRFRVIRKAWGRNRQFLSGQCAAHIIQLQLFSFIQIVFIFDQLSDMLLYRGPAQTHFLLKAPARQPEALTVVIDKTGGTIQVGMAVSSNTVFFLQKILRRFRRRMAVIQGSDPEPASGKAGTAPENMIDFLVRNRKCRGFCLCTGSFLYFRFLIHLVDFFNLLFFGRKLEADLDRFRFSVAQA